MKKNDIFELEITGMTDDGDGVGRAENMAVFVPYTIIGETVRVIIVKVLKNYAFGKLLDIIKPSENRVKAECACFYQCGGCQLWHMNIQQELEYKRQKVTDCLKRIGGLDLEAESCVSVGEYTRYRNKAQFPVTPEGIGFYRRNSHSVIPMEDCPVQGEWNKNIINAVSEWMEANNISAYDEGTHKGVVRHIYTRKGESGILVTIVTRTDDIPAGKDLVNRLCNPDMGIIGVIQNINEKPTNVVLGRKNKLLWGVDYITDSIGDVKFKISPLSFYQVNPEATEKLYGIAKEYAALNGSEVVWDLYCGIGTIGLFMAEKARKLIGVEIIPAAIENAIENAKLNNIDNTEFICGKAENIAPGLMKKYGRPDVVILDPPRKGCDENLLAAVAEAKPKRIVYVSCKPSTLARDLKYLTGKGYKAKIATPVNMFPKTSHIETVVLLCRTAHSSV